jgi:hypothetical protein
MRPLNNAPTFDQGAAVCKRRLLSSAVLNRRSLKRGTQAFNLCGQRTFCPLFLLAFDMVCLRTPGYQLALASLRLQMIP